MAKKKEFSIRVLVLGGIAVAVAISAVVVNGKAIQARLLGYDSGSSYLDDETILDWENSWESDDDEDGGSSGGYEYGPQNRSTSGIDKAEDGANGDDVSVPEGAIAVYSTIDKFSSDGFENASKEIICTQGSSYLNYLELEANFSDNKIYQTTTGMAVGEFTVVPSDFTTVSSSLSQKKYLGHIFPYKLANAGWPDTVKTGEQILSAGCFPPDFVSQEVEEEEPEVVDTDVEDVDIVDEVDTEEDVDVDEEEDDVVTTDFSTYFDDLPAATYYTEPAIELAEKDFLPDEFIDEKRIVPGQNITRCELMEIVVRAKGIDLPSTFDATFSDVPASHAKAKYVYAAKNEGWVNGKTPDFFDCDGELIRAEMAKILANALGLIEEEDKEFDDWGNTPDWAKPFIRRALRAGIMTGVGDKRNFAPMDTLSRADALTAISRIF